MGPRPPEFRRIHFQIPHVGHTCARQRSFQYRLPFRCAQTVLQLFIRTLMTESGFHMDLSLPECRIHLHRHCQPGETVLFHLFQINISIHAYPDQIRKRAGKLMEPGAEYACPAEIRHQLFLFSGKADLLQNLPWGPEIQPQHIFSLLQPRHVLYPAGHISTLIVCQQMPVQKDIRKSIQPFQNQVKVPRRLLQKEMLLIAPVVLSDPPILILSIQIRIFHDAFPDQHVFHLTGQHIDRKDLSFRLFSAYLPQPPISV